LAKLFEGVLFFIYSDFSVTDELKYCFKANVGCSNAIYALRSTIDYFQNHGSSVFAVSLDTSKAFDTVNHYTLLSLLVKLVCLKIA
jgi:peroxiredoxin